MILLPIGRDESTIQRHAWISYAIIIANVVMFLIGGWISAGSTKEADEAVAAAIAFVRHHPYLTIPQPLSGVLSDGLKQELKNERAGPPDHVVWQREQEQLDTLSANAIAAIRRLPEFRLGYVPADKRLVTIVTSMFFHAGFLHLFGNMLFFYLSGPFVEDVFGRPLFVALYATGGFAATLTYWVHHPTGTIPLIGASGAIAAVMGAYLVRFARSKIEFLLIPFWFRPTYNVRFFVPAFVVLPLWLGQQYVEMQSEASSGVAFSAHVGGFLYGAAVAVIVKLTSFEEKHVAPKIRAETTWEADPRLEKAMAARKAGDSMLAKEQIVAVLRDHPQDIDALRVAAGVARELEDDAMDDTYRTRLLTRYIETGAKDDAVDIVRELVMKKDVSRIHRLASRAAAFCEREGHRDWALVLYEKLAKADASHAGAIGAMLKIGALRRANGDVSGARTVLQAARAHPACVGDIAATVENRLAELPSDSPWQPGT